MACTPDTVTPKGVVINLNSGSDYTNCTVYTGLTDSVITGTTDCVNITGTTCSLTGLSATLMEVFVKIDCDGCCSNTFRVNLDECCGDEELVATPTPTPTYSQTVTPTYSQTPTPTFTPSACECNTYRITFNRNCGEYINWTDCDTNTLMSEQGDYFGLSDVSFMTGTVLDLCSCSLPTTGCGTTGTTISLVTSGCTIEGGFFITTPTPTPTPTETALCTCYELYTTPDLNPAEAFVGQSNFSYRSCETNEIVMIQISDEVEPLGLPSGTMICARTGSVELTSGDSGYSIEAGVNCCEPTPTPTPTPTLDSVPPLSVIIQTNYRMNQSSGYTSFEIDAPDSSSAETVLCQIINAHPTPQAGGLTARYYSNPLGVGTRLYAYTTPYGPIGERVAFYSEGSPGILDGGITYYLKTDVDGYITEYTLMTECQSKPWLIFECTDPCVGGICGCDGQTSATVFTDISVTDLTNPGVIVYSDAQLLTPFDGFISISTTIYYVSSGTVTLECAGGSGC